MRKFYISYFLRNSDDGANGFYDDFMTLAGGRTREDYIQHIKGRLAKKHSKANVYSMNDVIILNFIEL